MVGRNSVGWSGCNGVVFGVCQGSQYIVGPAAPGGTEDDGESRGVWNVPGVVCKSEEEDARETECSGGECVS